MPKPIKLLLGIVAIGVLVWVILFILKIAILLLPLAILVLGGYMGYKYLKSKSIV